MADFIVDRMSSLAHGLSAYNCLSNRSIWSHGQRVCIGSTKTTAASQGHSKSTFKSSGMC